MKINNLHCIHLNYSKFIIVVFFQILVLMPLLPSISSLKQSLFQSFYNLKCFDIGSETFLLAIYLIRFIVEFTIISYSEIITDSEFQYYFKIQQALMYITINDNSQITNFHIGELLFLLVIETGFFYTIFTFSNHVQNDSEKNTLSDSSISSISKLKTWFLKIQSIFIYTFRTLIIKTLAQLCKICHDNQNYPLLCLILFLILIITIQAFLLQQFTIQINLVSSNQSLLSKSYHVFNSLSEVLILATTVLVVLLPKDNVQYIFVANILFAIAYLLRLLTTALRRKYNSLFVDNLERFKSVSLIVFNLLVIPGHYVFLLKQNFIVSLIVIIIFLFISFMNYLRNFQEQSLEFLDSIPKTKQELLTRQAKFYLPQAHYLIHYINHLMIEYKRQQQQILICSILSQHFRLCKSPTCYCFNLQQENKMKSMMNHTFRSKFLLSFVENIYKQFNEEFDIITLYLVFKLQIVELFPQIEYKLKKYETNNPHLRFWQQYIIFQIKHILKKFLDDKNKSMEFVKIQKALIQQQNAKNLIENLRKILELSLKKIKLLSEGICNLNLIQQTITETSALIKQVQLAYVQTKTRNQFNLYTQSIFYFYFLRISQTNFQAKSIKENIFSKTSYLKSLKGLTTANMEKFLYSTDKCCVLESTLDPENMGIITNTTENCFEIFGVSKQELQYRHVRRLLPKFLHDQHDILMKEWVQIGSFKTVNQRKIAFTTNVKGSCFKCMVYLQISTNCKSAIKIYMMILKMQGQNYLLLDNKLMIQGFGEKIKDNIFSTKCLQEPFKNFCLNYKAIPQNYETLEMFKRYQLQLLISEEVASSYAVNSSSVFNNVENNFALVIQKFAQKNLVTSNEVNQVSVLKCKIQFSKIIFGSMEHFLMQFIDVTQIIIPQTEVDQLIYGTKRNSQQHKSQLLKSKLHGRKLTLGQKSSFRHDTVLYQPHSLDPDIAQDHTKHLDPYQNKTDSLEELNKQQNIGHDQSTSSMMVDEAGYSFKKLIKLIKEKFLYEKGIIYKELKYTTLILSFLICLLLVSIIVQYFFYYNKLNNFEKIMTANRIVSNTLQEVEFLYSKTILINQNCVIYPNPVKCQQAIVEISTMKQDFYDEIYVEFLDIIRVRATSDFPFYIYLQQQIFVKVGKTQENMSIQKFLQVFYYSIHKIALYMTNATQTNPKYPLNLTSDAANLFQIVNDNWNSTIKINHQIVQLYKNESEVQMNILEIILYSIFGVITLLNFLILILMNHFINGHNSKQQKMLRIYELVPISYIESVIKYLEDVLEYLTTEKDFFNSNQNDLLEFPMIEDNPYYRPKNQFFYSLPEVKKYTFLIIFFIFFVLGNFLSLWSMKSQLSPLENIFIQQTQLMIAQKKISEAFYEMKRLYLIQPNSTIRSQGLVKLMQQYPQTEVEFNKQALVLLKAFPDSSDNYSQDFKKLLTDDLCDLSRSTSTQAQYQNCKNSALSFPEHGIFAATIYIQRVAMIGLSTLKSLPPSYAPVVLASPQYQDMDLYSLFVMKVFQLIQIRISKEMHSYLENAYFRAVVCVGFQIGVIMLGVMIWTFLYKKKRQEFIQLYGYAIVYPARIIIKSNKVMKDIQECLVLKDY